MRPTETIQAVISGRLSTQDAPDWTRAGLSMATYRYACEVLSERTKEGRRAALERVPVGIWEDVEREAKALWNKRRQLTTPV